MWPIAKADVFSHLCVDEWGFPEIYQCKLANFSSVIYHHQQGGTWGSFYSVMCAGHMRGGY